MKPQTTPTTTTTTGIAHATLGTWLGLALLGAADALEAYTNPAEIGPATINFVQGLLGAVGLGANVASMPAPAAPSAPAAQ
jgi:hypothetical protein